jgi:hypothetical protein
METETEKGDPLLGRPFRRFVLGSAQHQRVAQSHAKPALAQLNHLVGVMPLPALWREGGDLFRFLKADNSIKL